MQYRSEYSVTSLRPYDCLVFAVFGDELGTSVSKVNSSLAEELKLMLLNSGLRTESSGYEIFCPFSLNHGPMTILVQFQSAGSATIKKIGKQLTQVLNHVHGSGRKSVLLCWSELKPKDTNVVQYYQLLTQFCEMSQYRGAAESHERACPRTTDKINFFDPRFKYKKSVKMYLEYGQAIARGINLSKSMSNLPANLCTPAFLAKKAAEIAKDSAVEITVLDETEMKKLNMGCILAVSKGSDQPARLIVMHYRGAGDGSRPVVLVGKGVTFDSGGYSIKSAPGMHEMKYDMSGAASVMATIQVISALNKPVNVVALIPCSENLIDGGAFKPGDVLTSMSGRTVEILSTDAEGRLLLADALTYSRRFNPALIIDVATLTGAAITALGYDISAMMSNNKKLSRQIFAAGKMSQDHVWPLPVWEEYADVLQSNFADMASSAGRSGNTGAGAIVAACFIAKFTDGVRWAHLDVAGTAWHRGKHINASGRPVALLSQFLINYSNRPF